MRIFGRRDDGGATGPVATYAAVLDGAHLWWHVPGHDRLLLTDDDGPDVDVTVDPFPLGGLTGARYRLHAGDRPVRAGELPDRRPSRAPLAPDGRTQYDVTADGGHLWLVRREVPVTAVLEAAEPRAEQLHLRITPPAAVEPGTHLVLADDADRVLGLLPMSAHEGHLDVLLGVDDLPPGFFGVLRLGVGGETSWVRVRRSHTDLADPNHAVLLPELADDRHPDRARARLRWSPDSLLAVRVLDPTAEDA